ncbi:cyanoexosortase B system-associated protein [Oculatella sp. LEGE 06141]|uniref:cyanoexosortase B system-associated protein n=1 Tax=Oculatella sp. LEGE 06141 TaxID=1828648 RepID=UPI0018829E7B|nr:cyanoexosortase B system-associated protein [Oculatella sp. LEGE 06141]MBE9181394.1 cyanoexosortase B system-associated protein [Oculatella sp. LEGE 06141]
MFSFSQSSRRARLFSLLTALFVLAIAASSAIPNYFTAGWSWNHPSPVPNIKQLESIQQRGLKLPGWQTLTQQVAEIGGHKWSVQAIAPESPADNTTLSRSPIVVLLRPQTWYRDQPQIDWMDINGTQQWTADSHRRLRFSVTTTDSSGSPQPPTQVEARFLRGWNTQQTYAVVQWYAWTNGGHSAPSRWFWVDQVTQWRDRHRMPWVAVSVLIPIKPLGDIEESRSLAETLSQTVQSSLMVGALKPDRQL